MKGFFGKKLGWTVALLLAVVLAAGLYFGSAAMGGATIKEETPFVIPAGSSLSAVAGKLEDEGLIQSSDGFLINARLFGSSDPIQAGEFLLTPDMSQGDILAAFQNGDVVRRFVTIPEGMPSILVYEKLMAEDLLTGDIDVPLEGSVLPDTYAFERGQDRGEIIEQMQTAMDTYLAEAWAKRGPNIAVETMREALILASVVEKETGTAAERGTVAGLYSNRVKSGMLLQADPTIIYPITKGKPLGRRIRQSEIAAVNGYNTYTRVGLPEGPITNPGRESIAAVLNPEPHNYLFMVADGTGGHEFNATLEGHNAAVEKWYQLRRERGEM
nr:endolytic transglycosylase MltG [Erythrobacter insulae]